MNEARYTVQPIGWVESPLIDRENAPRQGDEGAPDAWLVLDSDMRAGIRDLMVGTDIIVLTWLDRARRDVLVVHPRGDQDNPMCGVFSTRSADRPNPLGLHTVQIVAIDETRIACGTSRHSTEPRSSTSSRCSDRSRSGDVSDLALRLKVR
jgi:tRNA-Thr(GGU) m(6)t(6)A37 methyltransferase TsaA